MTKRAKVVERLKVKPADFTWNELVTIMDGFGYQLKVTGGSGRKFIHPATGAVLFIHEPHPANVLKMYQVRDAIHHLQQEKKL